MKEHGQQLTTFATLSLVRFWAAALEVGLGLGHLARSTVQASCVVLTHVCVATET